LQQTLASGYGARYGWLRRPDDAGGVTGAAQDDERVGQDRSAGRDQGAGAAERRGQHGAISDPTTIPASEVGSSPRS
jgi:hypothetical protein